MNRLTMRSVMPRFHDIPRLIVFLLTSTLSLAGAHAADGDPDTSFGGDGVNYVEWAGGSAEDARLGIGVDGKVYVGATINRGNGNRDFAITRLRTDGGLDITFGFLGYRSIAFDYVTDGSDRLYGVFPLSDGKLMLLGNAEVAEEITAKAPPAMVRLTAAGSVDTSFGVAGKLSIGAGQSPWPNGSLYMRGVARQPDGKFLFGGYCINCGETYSAVVLRVDGNGTPDTSFGQNGWAKVSVPQPNALWSMGIDRQGRIVLAGATVDNGIHRPLFVRMTSTGAADATFGGGDGVVFLTLPDTAEVNWGATAIAIDRGDALVVAVANYVPLELNRTALIRLTVDGTYDTSYGDVGLRELTRDNGSRIEALALRSDRRAIAAGFIDSTGGIDFYVARTLPDGSLDNTFDGNGVARYTLSTSQDEAQAMVLSAGKPVIAGRTYVSGGVGVSVLRLQSDLIFADDFE